MNEQEETERSERYIASNKRLLASLDDSMDRYMKEHHRKRNTLIQEIESEEKSLNRKRAQWA